MANRKLVCEWEVGFMNWAGCGDLASWASRDWVYGKSIGTGQGDWAGRMDQGMVWVYGQRAGYMG